MKRNFHVIGACSCWGAQMRACEAGPEALVQAHVFERLKKRDIAIDAIELLYPDQRAKDKNIPLAESLPLIRDFNMQLYNAVKKALQKKTFPIIVGGDHSIAVGTWNAFPKPFGLIWIDAHMDAHTPQTSPSGAYHGMPVAALFGRGLPEMAQLVRKEPVLQPENFAYIGVRSYESGEAALIKQLNVKTYFMDEVKKRGLSTIIPEAIAHVTRHLSHYGVSCDLDAFDPSIAPGVGSPEPGGIGGQAMLPLLAQFGKDPRFIGFELVEYNPERDENHKTAELAYEILKQVMKP
ncbi:MAG: arginase [Verrucomicrobiota bacterium]|nr:arginase [Verrucomicrobiota bacterium]